MTNDLEVFIDAIDYMNITWVDYLLDNDAVSGVVRIDWVLSGGKLDNGDNLELLVKFFRKIGWHS